VKFVQPMRSGSKGAAPHSAKSRPEWLKEWIENQGHYVELSCGCMEDFKSRGLLQIYNTVAEKFKEVEVFCVRCDRWVWLVRSVSLREWWGIPKTDLPDMPLF